MNQTEYTCCFAKSYKAGEYIEALKRMKVKPHVAQNTAGRRLAVAAEIAAGARAMRCRAKREAHRASLGWAKFVGASGRQRCAASR